MRKLVIVFALNKYLCFNLLGIIFFSFWFCLPSYPSIEKEKPSDQHGLPTTCSTFHVQSSVKIEKGFDWILRHL